MNRKTQRRLLLLVFFAAASFMLPAQTPTSCFEIESILVDACGNPEPENEMVRFRVGPNDLDVADLNVNWPNNSFLGICQNAGTAAKVAALNASIISCGLILEPSGGVLPSGAQVLLAGSVNMSTTANSFQSLTDTIYMIFQCAGNNSSGHFKNFENPPSSPRTLIMNFGASCQETVSYLPSSLVDINGNQTTADGAYVNFTWGGAASYSNSGCQAIIQQPLVDAVSDRNSVCPGDTILVSATFQNFIPSSVTWSGGTGTFGNIGATSTIYIAGPGDAGTIKLIVSATIPCGTMVSDSVRMISGSILSQLQVSSPAPYCKGDVLQLSASGGIAYQWSTGESTPVINVNTEGNYVVTVSNNCFSQVDSVYITFSEVSAAFYATPLTGAAPLYVVFTDSSSSNTIAWNWDFGDGNTSIYSSTDNIYTTAGRYPVSLKVTNAEGCTAFAYSEITVTGDTATFIPSAFTPNRDTKNEIFLPIGINVLNTTGTIYNRWGQVIFQWNNSEGWNGGDSNGKEVQAGIYIYDVHSTFVWGKAARYNGWVMLIR